MDTRRSPIREERLLTVHSLLSSKSLESDCGRDKVQQCHLLMLFQEGPHQKLLPPFNVISRRSTTEIFVSRKTLSSKFCKQGKLDYSRYY